MKHLLIFITIFCCYRHATSQDISFSLGTDIPYQYYLGINVETKKMDFSYRTGILTAPYSDAILDIIEKLGTDEIYIKLLDASFDLGWTNSLGAYYKFSEKKNWYVGTEVRLDCLTAADAPKDLIEAVTGQSIQSGRTGNRELELKLGLRMIAVGLRLGKSFRISNNDHHYIKAELSIHKYISTQSILEINGKIPDNINNELDRVLWDDVFSPYGYVGGLGIAYSFRF